MKSRRRNAVALLLVIALLAIGCRQKPTTDDSPDVQRGTDPKTLTLRVTDLPTGSSEAGQVFEATPENINDLHSRGELTDDAYEVLLQSGFKSLATRSFKVGDDGTVLSTVALFETEAQAEAYYDKTPPQNAVQDTETLGDESVTEVIDSGPPNDATDETVIDNRTVKTRVRVDNVVAEVVWTDDPSEVDVEDAIDLAERAVSRLG